MVSEIKQSASGTALFNSIPDLFVTSDLPTLAEQITRSCVDKLSVKEAWLGLINTNEKVDWLSSWPHLDNPPFKPEHISNALYNKSEIFITHAESKGVLFPLIIHDQIIGLLGLISDQSDFFTNERNNFLLMYCQLIASHIQQIQSTTQIQSHLDQIEILQDIDQTILSSFDIHDKTETILKKITQHLNVDATDIYLLDPSQQSLNLLVSYGLQPLPPEQLKLKGIDNYIDLTVSEKRLLYIENTNQDLNPFLRSRNYDEDSFQVYLSVPLIARNEVKGVLEAFNRTPLNQSLEWFGLLEKVTDQIAMAIDHLQLLQAWDQGHIEITSAYNSTIEGLSRALELRDRETEGHTRRVAEMTMRLAEKMGIPAELRDPIRHGALLHDIGKMGIPDAILLKPGSLNTREWEIMKHHPIYAFNILSQIEYLKPALDIPLYHHEHWDGSGYPYGLRENQIPLSARIFTVIDVYDALTSDRPYRMAWTKEQALEHIRLQAGRHFDPRIVRYFLELASEIL
jgi:HD-GYP domain-containing protein (c-di-GMP phosphodiesterase class II)